MIFAIFYLFALSAILEEINTRNYAILCKIENKMGSLLGKSYIRRLVFQEIETRKSFRMVRTRKLLVSRGNKKVYSTQLYLSCFVSGFNEFIPETNILQALFIRKIFRI